MIMIIIINHFLLRLTRTLRGTKSASLLMLISRVTSNPRLGFKLAFIKKEINLRLVLNVRIEHSVNENGYVKREPD